MSHHQQAVAPRIAPRDQRMSLVRSRRATTHASIFPANSNQVPIKNVNPQPSRTYGASTGSTPCSGSGTHGAQSRRSVQCREKSECWNSSSTLRYSLQLRSSGMIGMVGISL